MHGYTQQLHRINEKLEEADTAPLVNEETTAARLYTGPLYLKYNAVLRGCFEGAQVAMYDAWQELCHGNLYATTLHAINSAVVKLGKIQKVAKVYRGM